MTPNTQGACWEEQIRLLAIDSGVGDREEIIEIVRNLLSKERAEGERRGRNEFADKVAQDLLKMEGEPGVGLMARAAADFVLDTLNEYESTLPADSTEV